MFNRWLSSVYHKIVDFSTWEPQKNASLNVYKSKVWKDVFKYDNTILSLLSTISCCNTHREQASCHINSIFELRLFVVKIKYDFLKIFWKNNTKFEDFLNILALLRKWWKLKKLDLKVFIENLHLMYWIQFHLAQM